MGSKKRSIKTFYTWEQFSTDCKKVARAVKQLGFHKIYGIPRGGLIVATHLSYLLGIPLELDWKNIDEKTLIVDDIYDTGATLEKLAQKKKLPYVATLWFTKKEAIDFGARKKDSWVVFPWETIRSSKYDGTF